MNKRVIIVDTSNEIAGDGDIPHPAIGPARRMQVRDAGAAARRDDRGGREPHARGHRHRRDRHRAGGGGRAHDRRARRAARRHGARQHAREPDDEPDALRPHRRHPVGHAGRRRGAPPRHAEVDPRAQGAADVRHRGRDPELGPRRRPRRRRRDGRRDAARLQDAGRGARAGRRRRDPRDRAAARRSRRSCAACADRGGRIGGMAGNGRHGPRRRRRRRQCRRRRHRSRAALSPRLPVRHLAQAAGAGDPRDGRARSPSPRSCATPTR